MDYLSLAESKNKTSVLFAKTRRQGKKNSKKWALRISDALYYTAIARNVVAFIRRFSIGVSRVFR